MSKVLISLHYDDSKTIYVIATYTVIDAVEAIMRKQADKFNEWNQQYKRAVKQSELDSNVMKMNIVNRLIYFDYLGSVPPKIVSAFINANIAEDEIMQMNMESAYEIVAKSYPNIARHHIESWCQDLLDDLKEVDWDKVLGFEPKTHIPTLPPMGDTGEWLAWYYRMPSMEGKDEPEIEGLHPIFDTIKGCEQWNIIEVKLWDGK